MKYIIYKVFSFVYISCILEMFGIYNTKQRDNRQKKLHLEGIFAAHNIFVATKYLIYKSIFAPENMFVAMIIHYL